MRPHFAVSCPRTQLVPSLRSQPRSRGPTPPGQPLSPQLARARRKAYGRVYVDARRVDVLAPFAPRGARPVHDPNFRVLYEAPSTASRSTWCVAEVGG